VKESQQFFLFHGYVLDDYYLILEIYYMLESYRIVGIVCLEWVAIGYIIKQRVGVCYSSMIGRDYTGVVSGIVGLCTNGAYRFQYLTEAWVVIVFLAVIVVRSRATGKVFLYAAKVVIHCN
jgi:hypothetical protein